MAQTVNSKKILVTGGSGLLGAEILKLDASLIAPSHSELDITNIESVRKVLTNSKPDVVLHLAAATKPPEHEKHPELGLSVNILGTTNVAIVCLELGIKLVYTSSDYLYTGKGPHSEEEAIVAPNNFYLSKLAGECAVRLCPNSLVLRLGFSPVPYPWEKVYQGQKTTRLYADEIAPLVLLAAKSNSIGIMNLGGPETTLEDFAKRTKPEIAAISKPEWVPEDLRFNISKMKQELNIADENSLLKHL